MSTNELFIEFVNHKEVLARAILLPSLGIIFVSVRFYVRRNDPSWSRVDDWLILAALPFVIGMGAVEIYGVAEHAVGYPNDPYSSSSPIAQLTELTRPQRIVELVLWITWLLMIPANGLIKISSLFLYRRLFVVIRKSPFDIVTTGGIVICTLWTVAFFFATVFGCGRNFAYPWGTLEQIGSCNTNVRLSALMISDFLTNLMVWLLPLPMIWRTRMRTSRKIAATCVLLLAALSIAAALVRMIIQEQITHGGYAARTDVTLTLTNLMYWSMIESGLALIASCLPTLRLQVALSKVISTVKSRSSQTSTDPFAMSPQNVSPKLRKSPRSFFSISMGSTLKPSKTNSTSSLPLYDMSSAEHSAATRHT